MTTRRTESRDAGIGSRPPRGGHRHLARSLAVVSVALASFVATTGVADAGGLWSSASEVSALAALNTAGNAQINAISCSAKGDCSAIGGYSVSSTSTQAFVTTETNGSWSPALNVPGLIALNAGVQVGSVMTISCSSPGNCAAGGSYLDATGLSHAYVVNQVDGTWGTAIEVPGFAQLGTGGLPGALVSLSCTSKGDCSGGGIYGDTSDAVQGFVVDESDGTWGQATEVPGLGALNAGGVATILSVACGSGGNCAAGGEYTDAAGATQAFVVSEGNGTWGNAIEVPGTATLNAGSSAVVVSVSCATSGACGAAGIYTDANKQTQSFVADESAGLWGNAQTIGGVNTSTGGAVVNSLSCTGPGDCSVGGFYGDATNDLQAFVDDEVNGTWGDAIEVPNSATLNAGGEAAVESVSCAAAGYCSAGGIYTDAANAGQAFVVNEVAGTWGNALEVPNTATLNVDGDAGVDWISCAVDGSCAVGGYYEDASQNYQAFVDNSSPQFTTPGRASVRVASSSPGTIAVSVVGAVKSGGRPVTRYQYSLDGGKWKNSPRGTARHFALHHLRRGFTYRVEVRAVNVLGHGRASRAVSVVTKV